MELGVRNACKHAGFGREGHTVRQFPSGAGEGIRVRLDAARGRRERFGTVDADVEAEWRNGVGR